jgi:hypothetical protein
MFDANFYRTVLPGWVKTQCEGRPEGVPVVELRLADGAALDLCHIVSLDGQWMAVSHFRDIETCDDMDLAFLRYETVTRIGLSMHDPKSRRIGFNVGRTPAPSPNLLPQEGNN